MQQELAQLESILADNNLYDSSQKDQLKKHLSQQAILLQRQDELEENWLLRLEELEALQTQLEADV